MRTETEDFRTAQCAFCGKEKPVKNLESFVIDGHEYFACKICSLKYENKTKTERLDFILEKKLLSSTEIQIAKASKEKMDYEARYSKKKCLRCGVTMERGGTAEFQNANGAMPTNIAHFVEGTSVYYTLVCPSCGVVEFYIKDPE